MRNLFARVLAVVALSIAAIVQTYAQGSFAYQAVIRDTKGELITNKEVGLRFSLMYGGKNYYVETQKAQTNEYGNVSVIIGNDNNKVSGSMADVPWSTLDVTIKVEVDPAGGKDYKLLGETKINPAPYAMYAAKSGGAAQTSSADKGSESLFQVNDRSGKPVFEVTDNGIVVYVDDTDEGKVRRSGFLIVGRNATKEQPETEYFSVTADGTIVYAGGADQGDKVRRSGFLIVGRNATKDSEADNRKYMSVDDNGTHVYVDLDDDSDKVRRSGFLIVGRTATKDNYNDMFEIDGDQTTVYVDSDNGDKVRRSGFLIVGRNATKYDADASTFLTVTTDSTLLNTQSLTVTAPGDSVVPMQMKNGLLYFSGDLALDGEIRQWADLVERDTFSYYMSDLANRDDVDWDALEELDEAISNKYGSNYTFYAFKDVYSDSYYFDLDGTYYEDEDGNGHYHDYSFKRLATINEKGQLLPCKSDGIILLDRNSKETAFLEDAVVVLSVEYSWKLRVWPLTALTDYEMRFAMINDEYWDGYATQYERYDFVVNCENAYAGCKFAPIAQRKYDYDYGYYYDEYDVKITTSEGSETVNVHNNDGNDVFSVVFGSTVTLEALTAPEGMMFYYWLKKENAYDDYGVPYYANPLQVMVANTNNVYFEARFTEIPPILVDGDDGDDQTGDGYDKPFKTITRALQYVEQIGDGSSYKIAALNYSGDIAVGSNVDGKASSIIIDFRDNNQENEGTTTAQHVIDINTTVPVTIANGTFTRISADRVINVPAGKSLTFDNCVIWGGSASSLASVGGAYVGEGGKLTLKGSSIRYFYAENGGGVYVANGGNIEMDNNSYISNNEAENGGGIYIAGSS